MKPPYFVEILARNGEVRQRQRFEALPIRVGRGYHNDIILDDRHASASHALIELSAEDTLEVRDLDSRNGVICKGRRSPRMAIDGNTVFRIGHTSLRVRSADFPVADEMTDTTLHAWEGWPPALAGLVLMVLLILFDASASDFERFELIHYATTLASVLGMILLWSGGWALANHLFSGQTRFGRHLFIAACGMIAIEIVSLLCSVTAYAFSLETLTRYGSHLMIAIAAGMVYFHLLTVNPGHTRRFVMASVLLSVLGSSVALMVNYQQNGSFADELYMSDLLPPALRLSSDTPVARFLDQAEKLKAGVDAARSKTVSQGTADDDLSD